VIRPFLALVSLALLSASAVAQCAGGVCQVPRAAVVPPVIPAAVQTVRAAVANGFYRVGDVIQPVYGVWTPPAQPWYPPISQPTPQYMPPRTCPPGGCQPCPQPVQWQPFGGRFR
jgi:hypothetical protein